MSNTPALHSTYRTRSRQPATSTWNHTINNPRSAREYVRFEALTPGELTDKTHRPQDLLQPFGLRHIETALVSTAAAHGRSKMGCMFHTCLLPRLTKASQMPSFQWLARECRRWYFTSMLILRSRFGKKSEDEEHGGVK